MDAVQAAVMIAKAEPRIDFWVRLVIQSHGLFSAANAVLRSRELPDGDVADLAAHYREDAALMTAVRLYALFDRDGAVSFQLIHRLLKMDGVHERIANIYVDTRREPWADVRHCLDAIDAFNEAYARIPWKAHGRLSHLRNLGLAHLTFDEMTKSITYDELSLFVRLAGELSQHLSMMVQGANHNRLERGFHFKEAMMQQWADAIDREKRVRA